MARLTALSGYGNKGPAAFLLEMNGRRLLLDLGKGPDGDRRPDLGAAGDVDAVLISHGHPDHVGSLDLLESLGNPPVFATAPVRALSNDPSLAGASALPRRGLVDVAGLSVETGGAGHAPGAVWMRIGGKTGLLYTGDLSDESLLYAFDPPPAAAALVMDASYGIHDTALGHAFDALREIAARSPLLLPVPAGGRGLEMAVMFFEAGFDVSVCPAHRGVAAMMAGYPEWLAPGMDIRLRQMLDATRTLAAESEPSGVMLAAKPNADGGLAAELASRFGARAEVAIVFTGHLATGTPSQALVAQGQARFIRWNVHPRLSALRRLVDTVRPRYAMPAFVDANGVKALEAVCLDTTLNESAVMEW